jgi:hypothetical protein
VKVMRELMAMIDIKFSKLSNGYKYKNGNIGPSEQALLVGIKNDLFL